MFVDDRSAQVVDLQNALPVGFVIFPGGSQGLAVTVNELSLPVEFAVLELPFVSARSYRNEFAFAPQIAVHKVSTDIIVIFVIQPPVARHTESLLLLVVCELAFVPAPLPVADHPFVCLIPVLPRRARVHQDAIKFGRFVESHVFGVPALPNATQDQLPLPVLHHPVPVELIILEHAFIGDVLLQQGQPPPPLHLVLRYTPLVEQHCRFVQEAKLFADGVGLEQLNPMGVKYFVGELGEEDALAAAVEVDEIAGLLFLEYCPEFGLLERQLPHIAVAHSYLVIIDYIAPFTPVPITCSTPNTSHFQPS